MKKLEDMTEEEQKAYWETEHKQDLENDFQEFMRSPFESLRSKYYYRDLNREDAVTIQKMIEEKLGPDPEGELPEEGWRKSNWCSGG